MKISSFFIIYIRCIHLCVFLCLPHVNRRYWIGKLNAQLNENYLYMCARSKCHPPMASKSKAVRVYTAFGWMLTKGRIREALHVCDAVLCNRPLRVFCCWPVDHDKDYCVRASSSTTIELPLSVLKCVWRQMSVPIIGRWSVITVTASFLAFLSLYPHLQPLHASFFFSHSEVTHSLSGSFSNIWTAMLFDVLSSFFH